MGVKRNNYTPINRIGIVSPWVR